MDDETPLNGLVLIPRVVPGFNIVSMQLMPGILTDTVNVVFESEPGSTYRFLTSPNLQTWDVILASAPAHPTGSMTMVIDPAVPKTVMQRFYKVEKISP